MVKVIVNEGFSSLDGSYGPGETEMPLTLAKKYACFVTIIEEKAEKVVVKKATTPTAKKVTKKPAKKRATRKK